MTRRATAPATGYMSPVLLALLLACATERGVRDAPDVVSYAGWVYLGPPSAEVVLANGTLAFTTEEGAFEAQQPYVDYPGYWLAELPASTPFQLRIEGEGAYPTVWAGDAPSANGSWFAGALFAAETTYVDELFGALDTGMRRPGALADGATHLWGVPNEPDAWACEDVRVQGGGVTCYSIDESGALARVDEGPVDWFFAFDLTPGEVALDDGTGPIETWTTGAGDLVMALWLEHG